MRAWAAAERQAAIDEIVERLAGREEYDRQTAELLAVLLDAAFHMRVAEGRAALEDALVKLERFSETKEYKVISGAIDMTVHDRVSAYRKFIEARQIPGDWYGYYRGAENINPWSRRPKWLLPRRRRSELRAPVRWIVPGRPSDLTVLTAGNSTYFARYASHLLSDLAESTTPVHFHVVGWDGLCEQTLQKLDRRAEISISAEPYPHDADVTYFASVRFFRAHDFIRALGPLYISDLDNVFVRKPEEVRPLWGGADLVLKFTRTHAWLPWTSPNAGYVYIKDSIWGIETALLMANYVDHHFVPGAGKNWYFDQLLLNEVANFSGATIVPFSNASTPAEGRRKIAAKNAPMLNGAELPQEEVADSMQDAAE